MSHRVMVFANILRNDRRKLKFPHVAMQRLQRGPDKSSGAGGVRVGAA